MSGKTRKIAPVRVPELARAIGRQSGPERPGAPLDHRGSLTGTLPPPGGGSRWSQIDETSRVQSAHAGSALVTSTALVKACMVHVTGAVDTRSRRMVRRWAAALARVAVVGAAVLTGCDSVLVECVREGHPVEWCELVVGDLRRVVPTQRRKQ